MNRLNSTVPVDEYLGRSCVSGAVLTAELFNQLAPFLCTFSFNNRELSVHLPVSFKISDVVLSVSHMNVAANCHSFQV